MTHLHNPIFRYRKTRNGIEPITERSRLETYFSKFKEGEIIEAIYRRPRKHRSNNQNSYGHWMYQFIADEIGTTGDYIKTIFKSMFLKTYDIIGGKVVERIKGTSELSTVETEEFYRRIRQYCADELNIYIPKPNEIEIGEIK